MSPFELAALFYLWTGTGIPPATDEAAIVDKVPAETETVDTVTAETPQSPMRYSFSLLDEGLFAAGLRIPSPASGNRLIAKPSFAFKTQRWRAAADFATITDTGTDTHTSVRVREAYASVSVGEVDILAGKRLLRWGTGYSFTATGVLDPPRRVGDPGDRLNLNEGREMVKVDWTNGGQALTVAWATAGLPFENRTHIRDTSAIRYNFLAKGFDTAIIVAHDGGGSSVLGANFTRVFGDSVELHGEFANRDGAAMLIGGKYIVRPGLTVLAEYYTPSTSDYFRSSLLSPLDGRQHYGFLRVSKTRLRDLPGWKDTDIAFSILTNIGDHSRVLVSEASQRIGLHLSAYCYGQYPFGVRNRTEYGRIPYSALVSVGIRYQL